MHTRSVVTSRPAPRAGLSRPRAPRSSVSAVVPSGSLLSIAALPSASRFAEIESLCPPRSAPSHALKRVNRWHSQPAAAHLPSRLVLGSLCVSAAGSRSSCADRVILGTCGTEYARWPLTLLFDRQAAGCPLQVHLEAAQSRRSSPNQSGPSPLNSPSASTPRGSARSRSQLCVSCRWRWPTGIAAGRLVHKAAWCSPCRSRSLAGVCRPRSDLNALRLAQLRRGGHDDQRGQREGDRAKTLPCCVGRWEEGSKACLNQSSLQSNADQYD